MSYPENIFTTVNSSATTTIGYGDYGFGNVPIFQVRIINKIYIRAIPTVEFTVPRTVTIKYNNKKLFSYTFPVGGGGTLELNDVFIPIYNPSVDNTMITVDFTTDMPSSEGVMEISISAVKTDLNNDFKPVLIANDTLSGYTFTVSKNATALDDLYIIKSIWIHNLSGGSASIGLGISTDTTLTSASYWLGDIRGGGCIFWDNPQITYRKIGTGGTDHNLKLFSTSSNIDFTVFGYYVKIL